MHPNIIIIGGAPGTGKTTIARLLKEKLQSPYIDFGYLREFHLNREWTNQSQQEEQMTFENLVYILKNYIRNGYMNVIVTDLLEKRIIQIPDIFKQEEYKIVTLFVPDNELLKKRVLDPTRDSGYRNFKEAIAWNQREMDRAEILNEIKIDNSVLSPEEVVEKILTSCRLH